MRQIQKFIGDNLQINRSLGKGLVRIFSSSQLEIDYLGLSLEFNDLLFMKEDRLVVMDELRKKYYFGSRRVVDFLSRAEEYAERYGLEGKMRNAKEFGRNPKAQSNPSSISNFLFSFSSKNHSLNLNDSDKELFDRNRVAMTPSVSSSGADRFGLTEGFDDASVSKQQVAKIKLSQSFHCVYVLRSSLESSLGRIRKINHLLDLEFYLI